MAGKLKSKEIIKTTEISKTIQQKIKRQPLSYLFTYKCACTLYMLHTRKANVTLT